jgi:Phosphatidylethanolamine-binding protein
LRPIRTETICRGQKRASAVFAVVLIGPIVIVLAGCSHAADLRGAALELKSSSLVGDTIPPKYSSCGHQDGTSPELSWSAPPEHTQSFVLIAVDKDSPFGFKFTHWVLYDIPPDKRELPQDVAKQEHLSDGSRQGLNDYDKSGTWDPVRLMEHIITSLPSTPSIQSWACLHEPRGSKL